MCWNRSWGLNKIWAIRPPPNNDRLPTATTILESQFESLQHKSTFEQRPPVNSSHISRVTWKVVVHKFDWVKGDTWFWEILPIVNKSHYFLIINFCIIYDLNLTMNNVYKLKQKAQQKKTVITLYNDYKTVVASVDRLS